MPSVLERLNADRKESMRAGETVRRDQIRGLIAMLRTEEQSKLTRALTIEGLILHGDSAELSPDQQSKADQLRASTSLSDDEEQAGCGSGSNTTASPLKPSIITSGPIWPRPNKRS